MEGRLGLFDLFGDKPVEIKAPVGPAAPNRRPDVAKVETFLDRTGQLDLITTDGPTGYYGSRVDQGIRRFQKDNALKVDGLVKPEGPTIQRLGTVLLQPMDAPARGSTAEATPDVQRASVVGRTFAPSPASPLAEQLARRLRSPSAAGESPAWATRGQPGGEPGASVQPTDARGNQGDAAREPPDLTPTLDRIEDTYRGYARAFRRMGLPTAADNLEHYLAGSGEPRRLPREEIIKLKPLRDAEEKNIERFANATFRGRTEHNNEVRKLARLQEGESYKFSDSWDRSVRFDDFLWNVAFGDRDFAFALGRATLTSEGDFNATRNGDAIIITGTVRHSVSDEYDFHPWQPGADGALALQKHRGAKPFWFEGMWRQPVRAIVPVENGRLGRPVVTWSEAKD